MSDTADEKRMKLRYAGTCRLCGIHLPARIEAVYERTTKKVRCLACRPADEAPAAVDIGTPGGSARREYERRHGKREQRIRTKHPKIGGLILGLSDDPHSTTAWQTGALGEERLGQRLNALASDSVRPDVASQEVDEASVRFSRRRPTQEPRSRDRSKQPNTPVRELGQPAPTIRAICPNSFLTLPVSGVCGSCG